MKRIFIGGDIAPVFDNYKDFISGNPDILIGVKLQSILSTADYSLFNLENPLYKKLSPGMSFRECLGVPVETIKGIKIIAPFFLGLANNHIMDQGEVGLNTTIQYLDAERIEHAGAGKDVNEASKCFVKNIDGLRLGIYCCAEHEFSIAGQDKPGANPYDPLESRDGFIEYLKKI